MNAEATFQQEVQAYIESGRSVIASSSFQTQSMPLLHLISRFCPDIPVYFLDTGFHYPETLAYRDEVAADFGLNVVSLRSSVPMVQQVNGAGRFLFTSDPDRCCDFNKIVPMQSVLAEHDVWITGVRKDQSAHRAAMKKEAPGPFNVLRYHPMLDWDRSSIWRYISAHKLKKHPMHEKGYISIGCEPCTAAPSLDGIERSGRWLGLAKTECGLHTDLSGSTLPVTKLSS